MTGGERPKGLMASVAPPLVLASGSRFRRQMLEAAGLEFTVTTAALDEVRARQAMAQEMPTITPRQVALRLAKMKAAEVSGRNPGAMVIGADQVLDFDGEIYGKPADPTAARAQLSALRGCTHALRTAVALVSDGQMLWSHVADAQLTMRDFSDGFLDAYVSSAGDIVTETVGGYALEGYGAQLFSQIDGDYFTIIGLPLLPLLGELRQRGVLLR